MYRCKVCGSLHNLIWRTCTVDEFTTQDEDGMEDEPEILEKNDVIVLQIVCGRCRATSIYDGPNPEIRHAWIEIER